MCGHSNMFHSVAALPEGLRIFAGGRVSLDMQWIFTI